MPTSRSARRRPLSPRGCAGYGSGRLRSTPTGSRITLDDGRELSYDSLVLAAGRQLDPESITGLSEALGNDSASTDYRFDLAPRTWEFIQQTRGGAALFTMPPGPVKCAGAPQKIASLAAGWWRRQGVLDRIRLRGVLLDPGRGRLEEVLGDSQSCTWRTSGRSRSSPAG
jgi:sulfide:quinone oxidoreductase